MIARSHITDSHLTDLTSHLVQAGKLSPSLAAQTRLEAEKQGLPVTTYLVKNNLLSSDLLAQTCATRFSLPLFDLKNFSYECLQHLNLDCEFIQRYRIIPLLLHNNILQIGMSDPTDKNAIEAVKFHTGYNIQLQIISEDQLSDFLQSLFKNEAKYKNLIIPKELTLEQNQNILQENPANYDEPLIRFVDNVIHHAITKSASDIHIEPFETTCRIRYRQNGNLYEITEIPAQLASRLITRLKVMSKLDITERRLPQDGRFSRHAIDIRINICPTLFGEKIVLRLLDSNKQSLDINELGFTDSQKNIFLKKISQPQGLVLVTGPTVSGKTVTLYSALNYLNTPEKNILTVEDPVEIQLKGINQVNINPKIGLDFSNTLRTFLRQDPDIIMLGEIRDHETAEIAVKAAQTGHLVLSTLHTNSAIETLTRLQCMGIPSYNIISSISLIIAQRLVRKLCSHCKQLEPSHNEIDCNHCQHGFQGRTAIYEFLPITDELSQLILSGANTVSISQHAKQEGFITLREAGLEKVAQGITTLSEINGKLPS